MPGQASFAFSPAETGLRVSRRASQTARPTRLAAAVALAAAETVQESHSDAIRRFSHGVAVPVVPLFPRPLVGEGGVGVGEGQKRPGQPTESAFLTSPITPAACGGLCCPDIGLHQRGGIW